MSNEYWSRLCGKRIVDVHQVKYKNYTDAGQLILEFEDGSKLMIVSSYGGYDNNQAADEYPTEIDLVEGSDIESFFPEGYEEIDRPPTQI